MDTLAQALRSARARMVATQIAGRGVRDDRVLAAMLEIPREVFVPPERRADAYEDRPLPIGSAQTISQPFIVGRMLELCAIQPTDHALEIGTGTGYQSAVLSRLTASVVTIERHEDLATAARENLARLAITNVEVRVGDGTLGAVDRAPFDVIIVAAGGPSVPPALCAQLAMGGRLVGPFGDRAQQRLARVTRIATTGRPDSLRAEWLDAVVFVPLLGAEGWPSDE